MPITHVPPSAPLQGRVLFEAEGGRRYHQADAAAHPRATPRVLDDLDSRMRKLEYDLLGAFAVSDEPTDTIRAYLSRDRTVVAIQYLSALAVGGTQFLCRLEGDALVVASNAFVLEFKKAGYFAEFLQNVEPAALHAAVLTRRVKLAEKHGRPVTLAADLESAARLWEEQRTRLATRR